ncbi:MAG: DUF393 domain-containing protein [Planctomycetes bacterium]|nr:DUF393 domain-containing protein [Planctomycetota bacterium]
MRCASSRVVGNGWTGGQYSIVRACACSALAVRCAVHAIGASAWECALLAVGCALALSTAIGLHERASAMLLAPTLIAVGFLGGERGPGQVHWLALALMLHLGTSRAPFGAWDARGRIDPRGAWRMPSAVQIAALLFLIGALATFVLSRSRPYLAAFWYAALAWDPAWIPARGVGSTERVYYDGACGLCHGVVRLVLAEDRSGVRFRCAPLQGETFARALDARARQALPDSVVVVSAAGEVLTRSNAIVHLLAGLGGLWRLLGLALHALPRPLRDFGYDSVARVRKRVFAAPAELCPLLPPDLAARFDP